MSKKDHRQQCAAVSKYRIEVTNPAPSLNTTATIVEGTYEQVKETAREMWRAARETTKVCSESGHYWWYYITYDGKATDRNTFGGVEKTEQL
jgi:hypothetical protein